MISVVIGTYNHAPLLNRTLESIFAQKAQLDFEVVVVNDSSTDDTLAVMARHPVIGDTIERRGTNPARARNRAIQLAKGEVLIMQSDDVYHGPDVVRSLVAVQHPGTANFATVRSLDAAGGGAEFYTHPKTNRRPFFFLGSAWRKDVLAVGGNDETFTTAGYEDNWLADCLAHQGCRFVFHAGIEGFHQFHERSEPRYDTRPSQQFYRGKVADAEAGRIPWRAGASMLLPGKSSCFEERWMVR